MTKKEFLAYFIYYKNIILAFSWSLILIFIFSFLYAERIVGDRYSVYGEVKDIYFKSTITGNKKYFMVSHESGVVVSAVMLSVDVGDCVLLNINETLLGRTVVESYSSADLLECERTIGK